MYTNSFWDEATTIALRTTASASLSLEAQEKAWPVCGQVVRYLWEKLGGPQNLASDAPPRYWLDIGSRDGVLAVAATTFGFDVTALGMDAQLAQELQNCRVQACSYTPLLSKINGKSCVAAVHDLEFTPYPELVLHHIHTILEPDAFLLICYDEKQSAGMHMFGADGANQLLQNPRRLHLFDRKVLTGLLERNGFQVEILFPGEGVIGCVLVARAKPRMEAV